jgi:hypothetical protein
MNEQIASAAFIVLYSSPDFVPIMSKYDAVNGKFAEGDRTIAESLYQTLLTQYATTLNNPISDWDDAKLFAQLRQAA